MDILMQNLNGIETAKKLRSMGCHAEIIFLTSIDSYVFDSFEASPLNYLLKDRLSVKKFNETLMKAFHLASRKSQELFYCESGAVKRKIPLDSIIYFELRYRIICVYFDDKTFEFYSSLDKVMNELEGKGFIRCHKSYVINLKCVTMLEKNVVTLNSRFRLPIGPKFNKEVKLSFLNYCSNND